jgi:hypothetical protein
MMFDRGTYEVSGSIVVGRSAGRRALLEARWS